MAALNEWASQGACLTNENEQGRYTSLLPVPKQDEQDEQDRLSEMDAPDLLEFAGEDAQSLVGLSISRAAARFLSPNTPAAEKAAAMEDLDGGGIFQGDEDTTTTSDSVYTEESRSMVPTTKQDSPEESSPPPGNLSSTELPAQELPTPWAAGAKPLVIERLEETRSVLRDAVGSTKRRTLSGGADALKKMLPSIPKAGSFLPTLPSNSIFSSVSYQKGRDRALSLYKEYVPPSLSSSTNRNDSPAESVKKDEFANGPAMMTSNSSTVDSELHIPPLRRVTSDGSLPYHSLSRSSSLGDDARFANQRDMINSRMKAIRDSLQDRSSFRLPAMPSMPSMPRVPNFIFPLSIVSNPNSAVPQFSWKASADNPEDILAGNSKKRLNVISDPAVKSGMGGASISRPDAAIDSAASVMDKFNDSQLERATSNLTGDVVIMGGYRGSILRSAKPPHRQIWVPVKVGLNIRKVNLEVGLDVEDEERMEDSIFASGMLQHIGPVDISRRLFKRLRDCENTKNGKLRIWDYGYDWRLSPHLLSKKFLDFIRNLPSNRAGVTSKDKGALVIAHSLGGLITRHAVNQCPDLFSGVIYAGVPQACINILGPLRNGDSVLLSSRVLTAQVNFTLRTSFALLPLDGQCFVDKDTKEKYPVDFFDVDDWVKYRLSPCTDPPLPPKSHPSGVFTNILKQGSLPNLQLPNRNNPNRNSHAQNDSTPDITITNDPSPPQSPTLGTRGAEAIQEAGGADRTLAPQMGSSPHQGKTSISTTVTIPRDKAISYLQRTLTETKKFKLELGHLTEHRDANRYPPLAIIYGKSVPTVYAARVEGRDAIARTDCYDDLAFASGDGVCLSREAMLPEGYQLVKGGRISSDRGHLTLLGDLNAVGRAIQAVTAGRAKKVGLGR